MKPKKEIQITQLLHSWHHGDEDALQKLITLVYDQLCKLAHEELLREWDPISLQTKELVHRAFDSLCEKDGIDWQNRNHFFRVAAKAMRRVLILDARKRHTEKRGGNQIHSTYEDYTYNLAYSPTVLLAINEALKHLTVQDQQGAQIFEMRFFAGFTVKEVSELLEVSGTTVKRKWNFAKTWIFTQIKET